MYSMLMKSVKLVENVKKITYLLILLLLSACSAVGNDLATEQAMQITQNADAIATAIQATVEGDRQTSPRLIVPQDSRTVTDFPITLRWEWTRRLRDNEAFEIRMGQTETSRAVIGYASRSILDITDWVRAHPATDYYWSVQVVVFGADGNIREQISVESDVFHFSTQELLGATPTHPPPKSVQHIRVAQNVNIRFYGQVPIQPNAFNHIVAMTFDETDLYVLTTQGDIYVLRDINGDLLADGAEAVHLEAESDLFEGAMDIVIGDGMMYIYDNGRVSMLSEDGDGDLLRDTLTPIFTDLSTHQLSTTADALLYADGDLYIGTRADTHNATYSSVIVRTNADGTEAEVFATGFHQPAAFTQMPNGDLLMVDNNPTQFDAESFYLAPDELNHLREGIHYGYPLVYGDWIPRGTLTVDIGDPPIALFPPSSTATGLAYGQHIDGREGVFVSLFGTGAPTALARGVNVGHKVVFVPLFPTGEGSYFGTAEDFAVFDNGSLDAPFRPVDVEVGMDNTVYVAEWETGIIYRISDQ